MTISVPDICNLALDSIGTRSTINNINEPSKEANACKRQYSPALEAILQAAHWNFARAQVSLTLLRNATLNPPESVPPPWAYEYAYPDDCIQGRYLMPFIPQTPDVSLVGTPSAGYSMGAPVRWLVSSDTDDSGNRIKVILTNQPNAILVYTTRITDTSLFDGQFVQALANYLGWLICPALTGDKAMRQTAGQTADRITKEARASNGNEGITVIDSVPDWVRVRGYLSDWAFPPGSLTWCEPQNLTLIT